MNKDNRTHWRMEGRHNDEVHCSNCNYVVGVQYDEEDNITGVPMVCPKCKSQMSNTINILVRINKNEISEEFRKLLYDLLSKYSVGNVSFGVLKTFYEDEHVLYDEIIEQLPANLMPLIETALKEDGVHVFMMHIVEAGDTFNNLTDTEYMFDRQVSLIIFDMLTEKSKFIMRANITIEAIVSKPILQYQQTAIDKINDALSEYGFKVTKFETPPMRFLNKEEYDEYMKGQI